MGVIVIGTSVISGICIVLIITLLLPFSSSSRMSVINWVSKFGILWYIAVLFLTVLLTANIFTICKNTDILGKSQRDAYILLIGLVLCIIVAVLKRVIYGLCRQHNALHDHLCAAEEEKYMLEAVRNDHLLM